MRCVSAGGARVRSCAGFTLLEMLIAITLLGVMMGLLFGSLRTTVRVWESGEKRAAQVGRMAIIESFLRAQLSNAMPLVDDISEEDTEFSFKGTQHSLRFVSSLPAAAGRGGLHIFELELVRDGRDTVLRLTLRPFYPLFDEAEGTKEEIVILEGIETMELAYYGLDLENDEHRWFDEWEDKDALPELVRVYLSLEGEDPWPTLYVAPKLDILPQ